MMSSFQFELPDSNTCRQAADHEQYCSVLRCGIDTDLPVKSSSDYEHFFKGMERGAWSRGLADLGIGVPGGTALR
jgi:hypothetical protein